MLALIDIKLHLMSLSFGYQCVGGTPTSIDVCSPICGDGFRIGVEECDDDNTGGGDGCSASCTIETGYACQGGSPSSKDTCYVFCSDGFFINPPEECDDGNVYDNDGCSSLCKVEPEWICEDDGDWLTPHVCVPKCGNGKRTVDEECDDGNTFNNDGCDSDCKFENGFICSGGSTTTPDSCIENQFMPIANLTVQNSNDLTLAFNDSIEMNSISQDSLQLRIYGKEPVYNLTWTASFTSTSTVLINTDITTKLLGSQQEIVVVEFLIPDSFKSVFSGRGSNPDSNMTGFLFQNNVSASSDSLGQTAMILFLFSLFIAGVSSFGGNSMEMTWNLMNTLQILFYLSYVYVNYPTHLTEFFKYLKYANAENQYIAALTFMVIPEEEFSRGSANDRLDDKAFIINSADKIPILFLVVVAFVVGFIISKVSSNFYKNKSRFNFYMDG